MNEPSNSPRMTSEGIRWEDLIEETAARLRARLGDELAAREARWIVDHYAGVDELGVDARREFVTQRGMAAFDSALARRSSGEPLQYVLGSWPFRRLDLMVDPRVLIPRPETEWLVGVALDEVRERSGALVVDLGCGSGAIGLSVAVESDASVWMTDVSADALSVARANLAGIGRAATRVSIACGSWFEALPADLRRRVDLIVSNPPYIGSHEEVAADVVDWEPHDALFSGTDGLDAVRVIVGEAAEWLSSDGVIVCEVGDVNGAAAADLARGAGFDAELRDDLAGRPRAIIVRWPTVDS